MSANQRGLEHAQLDAATSLFAIDPLAVKIGKEIGKGAFSVVYKGEFNKKAVAVKCQPKDADGQIPLFVLKEVQLLAQLQHPNILEYIGAADHRRARQVLILSEHSNHGDLDQLLTRIRAQEIRHHGWRLMARIALDIAQGIAFLHARQIIHRDIKSSNILLDDAFRAKLCDFGFATETKRWNEHASGTEGNAPAAVRRKSYCGTDAFMAPEMFLDEDYGDNVDVFSLGVVLMELLCCRRASHDGFLQRLPQYKFRILEHEFRDALPLSCPPALAALALQCAAFEPSERPTSASVVSQLREIVGELERKGEPEVEVELRPFTPLDEDVTLGGLQLEEDEDGYEEEDDEEEEEEEEEEDGEEEEARAEEGPSVRVLAPVHYSGVLLKRNRRGRRGWSEKLFVLDRDTLHYTDAPSTTAEEQQQEQQQEDHQPHQPENGHSSTPQQQDKANDKNVSGRRGSLSAPPSTMSSLFLKDCRIWKTMEMPELSFHIVNGRWKIVRELHAASRDDLVTWMSRINQGIDFANAQLSATPSVTADTDRKQTRASLANTSSSSTCSSSASRSANSSRNKTDQAKSRSKTKPNTNTKTTKSKNKTKTTSKSENNSNRSLDLHCEGDGADTGNEDPTDEVYQWLLGLQLQRFTATLKAKGFASVDFIRETGIEEDDLNFLGIKDASARRTLMAGARTLRGEDD